MTHSTYPAPMVLDVLGLARRVADYAESVGFSKVSQRSRPRTGHLGAALADCVLQAGVNYRTVVRPRVERIILLFPECATLAGTTKVVESRSVNEFLLWNHAEKVERFTSLYRVLHTHQIEDAGELRLWLKRDSCRDQLLQIRGIGPKTVDYLCCLVGIDSIAVDRHIKGFSRRAGIESNDYELLKTIFCCAADLLGSSRRDFDAWVWTKATQQVSAQGQCEIF